MALSAGSSTGPPGTCGSLDGVGGERVDRSKRHSGRTPFGLPKHGSKAFFAKLGFTYNPLLTDDTLTRPRGGLVRSGAEPARAT
jgi:hypothetical protein